MDAPMMDRPDVSWPERFAIALVAVPVALFFATWFQPLIGIPAAAITIWTAWSIARGLVSSPLPSRRSLAFILLIAIVWTWLAGIGGFFQQMPDHNFRNALLHDLIDNSWPVLWNTKDGVVALDYYLGWSLIPALVGKALGWKAAIYAMAAICAAGMFLVLLVFVRVVGSWRWWIPLVFVLWSGMDILGWAVRTRLSFEGMLYLGTWSYPPLWYLSNMINYFCTPHLALPAWLLTLIVAGRRVGPRGVLGLSALLFPLAPYHMVGLLPFAAWGAIQGDDGIRQRLARLPTLENILLPLVALAMCAPFYLANFGAGQGSGWFFENSPSSMSPWVILAVFLLVEVLIVGAAIWMCGQRDFLLLLALLVLCIVPLRQSGLSNDLALKVSIPGLAILTVYTAKALLTKTGSWARWVLIGVFAIGVVTPVHEVWLASKWTLRDLSSLEADNIRSFDPNRPQTHSYPKFVGNFLSHPLDGFPLLRWMLADRASTR
jgi:hypothetical protein